MKIQRRFYIFHGDYFDYQRHWQKKLADIGLGVMGQWQTLTIGRMAAGSTITNCFEISLATGEVVFFKRYVWRSFQPSLFLLPSKPAIEMLGMWQLQQLNIPSLDVLAYGEQRYLGYLTSAFIVTKAIPNSQDLETFAIEQFANGQQNHSALVYQLANQLLSQVAQAHKARFFHYDLKWRNILIQFSEADDNYKLYWIDCPRSRHHHWRWKRGIIVDLSALSRLAVKYFSVYQRYRLLKLYLKYSKDNLEATWLFKKVTAHLIRRPPEGLRQARKARKI